MKRRIIKMIVIALIFYVLSYGYFRQTHLEKNETYLMIGAYEWELFHIYQPLIILDCSITGIKLGQRG